MTKNSLRAKLDVIVFKEAEEMFVAYAPAIDVSSYGDSQEGAMNALKEAVDIYFDYTRKKGTLEKDLTRLGWKRESIKSTSMIAPELEKIRQENPLLVNIMNSPENYSRRRISIPA